MTAHAANTLERSRDVVSTPLGEGEALLDMVSNNYFSLNEVGAFVWGLLARPVTRGDILDAIVAEFDVSRASCETDIDLLIAELHDAALIRSGSHPG